MTSVPLGRRRSGVVAVSVLALVSTMLLGAAPSGAAPACGKKLAVLGPLTGDAASFGIHITNGAELAVAQYNANHAGCEVTLVEYDSQGDPSSAQPLAQAIVNDASVLGVVGPVFSGESLATGRTFAQAGLPTVSPSATNPLVSRQGWKTFHRIVTTDAASGPLVARYISKKLKKNRVAIVTDGSDYGLQVARGIRVPLGKKVVLRASVRPGQKTFKALVQQIRKRKVQAVVFGGFYLEAGRLAKQLSNAGYRGPMIGGDGLMDPGYRKLAGATVAARAHIVSGTAPATLSPSFTSAYRAANGGRSPGLYALEAYDSARVFLSGINSGAATRAAMRAAVDTYNANGLTKPIRFTATGELVRQRVWVYKPVGSAFSVRTRLG